VTQFTEAQRSRAAETIGSRVAFQFDVLPLGMQERLLHLGAVLAENANPVVLEPKRAAIDDALGHRFDIELHPMPITVAELRDQLGEVYKNGDQRATGEDIEDAPALKLLDEIVGTVIRNEGSDIHIERLSTGGRARFKIDGRFAKSYTRLFEGKLQDRLVYAMKRLAALDTSDIRNPKRGVFARTVDGRVYDLRATFVPTRNRGQRGEKAIVRVQSQSARFIPLEDSGMSEAMQGRYNALIARPNGLDLLVGPQNAGKTNLLYALSTKLRADENHVMTTEAPIESDDLTDVTQVEVDRDHGVTFEDVVDKQYSADVDHLLFGEAKGRSSRYMFDQAMGGSHVIGTYHGYGTILVPERLVEEGVPRGPLIDVLGSILACRLIPRLCSCKLPAVLPGSLRSAFPELLAGVGQISMPNPAGCTSCKRGIVGYRGRIGTFELLVFNKAIRAAYHARASADEIEAVARQYKWHTMLEDALRHIVDGKVGVGDVMRRVPHEFEELFEDVRAPIDGSQPDGARRPSAADVEAA